MVSSNLELFRGKSKRLYADEDIDSIMMESTDHET